MCTTIRLQTWLIYPTFNLLAPPLNPTPSPSLCCSNFLPFFHPPQFPIFFHASLFKCQVAAARAEP